MRGFLSGGVYSLFELPNFDAGRLRGSSPFGSLTDVFRGLRGYSRAPGLSSELRCGLPYAGRGWREGGLTSFFPSDIWCGILR